jgi:hypothetical protein
MINLYYISASNSIFVVPDNPSISNTTYANVTIQTTASAYDTSGSTFDSTVGELRVYIKSGSSTIVSFPADNTVIYYDIYPGTPFHSLVTGSSPNTSSFSANYNFYPNTIYTSSLDVFAIYTSSLASASIYQTQSLGGGIVSLNINTKYTVVVSGSGQFYSSSILIFNNSTYTTESYVTSSNSYLTASLSSSIFNSSYYIEARTQSQPYLVLTYNSKFPVADTSSLSQWNSFLNITASSVSSSGGNTIYLIGGNISSINTFNHTGSNGLNVFTSSFLPNLTSLNIINEDLTTFPNLTTLPNIVSTDFNTNANLGPKFSYLTSSQYLQRFIFNNNNLTGSISNVITKLPTGSIQTIDIHNNSLTGSIPFLSSSFALQTFIAYSNSLSGSISGFDKSYNLQYFDVHSNALTGSIPNLTDCTGLTYFDVNTNSLNGSIPSLQYPQQLAYFICNNNSLTGYTTISTGTLSPYLLYFNAQSNSLSQIAVDNILYDLDTAGSYNGTVILNGTGNNTPSAAGLISTSSLVSKGWTVNVN